MIFVTCILIWKITWYPWFIVDSIFIIYIYKKKNLQYCLCFLHCRHQRGLSRLWRLVNDYKHTVILRTLAFLTISSSSSKSSLSTTCRSVFSFSFSLLASLAGSTNRSLMWALWISMVSFSCRITSRACKQRGADQLIKMNKKVTKTLPQHRHSRVVRGGGYDSSLKPTMEFRVQVPLICKILYSLEVFNWTCMTADVLVNALLMSVWLNLQVTPSDQIIPKTYKKYSITFNQLRLSLYLGRDSDFKFFF